MAVRRPPTTFSDDITAGDLAANSVTASELADNAVDSDAIAANAVVTAKIADSTGGADGITTAKLATDAVTSAKIATGAVVADGIGAGAVVEAGLGAGAVTTAKLGDAIAGIPHIKPGVLQPAVAGKLLDGTTNHSGAYGTTQADGHQYYYTSIVGSLAINDPRIGAHYGSTRHKFKQPTRLEKNSELASAAISTRGVWTIDGREWARCSTGGAGSNNLTRFNRNDGMWFRVHGSTVAFFEITGYFSGMNILGGQWTGDRGLIYSIDGGSNSAEYTSLEVPNGAAPLSGRFQDDCSVHPMIRNLALGIHTVKIRCNATNDYADLFGIEFIVQDIQDFTATNATNILTSAGHTLSNGDQIRLVGSDLPNGLNATTTYFVIGASGNNFQVATTSTGSAVTFSDDGTGSRTFRSLNTIQIPAQNIVSYGKKFSVSATAQHYNPFAYAADGTTAVAIGNTTSHGKVATGWSGTTAGHFDSTLDTATSLGLSAWEKGGNYWRPVNGGRIVKWIDSSGNIKTSVNMMPPAASTCTGSLNESNDPDGSSWLTQDLASHKFTGSGTANFTLSEIAKTFSYREFGNGQAGSGTNTWRDLSYIAVGAGGGSPNAVYYMEDGLTGFAGLPYIGGADHMNWNASDFWYWSFIGTGIGQSNWGDAGTVAGSNQWCQNLPYGTHVIKLQMHSNAPWPVTLTIDGRQITTGGNTGMMSLLDLHILQPKKPPIPEDACIISDYMLMADPVLHGGGVTKVSKGVRRVSSGWDHLYKSNVTPALSIQAPADHPSFKAVSALSSGGNYVEQRLPYFGTDFLVNHYGDRCGTLTENLNSDIGTEASISQTTWSGSRKHTGNVLGHNEMKNYNVNGAGHGNEQYVFSTEIVTPIHTSNHYRQFEDLYLKTLVGGDRNMEQHDLIVSADGKTWDETCRSNSYIDQSAECVYVYVQGGSGFNNISDTTEQPFDIMRGDQLAQDHLPCHNKDWAIARNMFLCLVPGTYRITSECLKSASATHTRIRGRDTKQGWGAQVNKTFHTGGHQIATSAHVHNHIAVVRYFERGDLVCATGQYHADSWNRFKIERVGSKK